MKCIFWILFISLVGLALRSGYRGNIPYKHCGVVSDKYITNAYKNGMGRFETTEPSAFYIIFKADSIGFIKIKVNTETYYSENVGDKVCFDLSQSAIEQGK